MENVAKWKDLRVTIPGFRWQGYPWNKQMRGLRLPDEIEEYRDARWQREGAGCVETAEQAERFIDRVGFTACLTDSRRPGPSLYVAVCGRRDAILPRNVQKDPESSHTWV